MKISIVTVTKNNIAGLRKTLTSITAQRNCKPEIIIVDGDSSDGTREFLIESTAQISRWISEADQGIYDAMNKGILHASGDWIMFLNGGDTLPSEDTLASIENCSSHYDDAAIIYADALEELATGELRVKRARSPNLIFLGMFTHHQAMLFRRSDILSGYNSKYKIAGDYALVASLLSQGKKAIKHSSHPLCIFEHGGLSQRRAVLGRGELIAVQKEILQYNALQRFLIEKALSAAHKLRTYAPFIYNRLRFRSRREGP